MDEFHLIKQIVEALGGHQRNKWVALGPGDDAAIIDAEADTQQVASIDTLLAGVHFPEHAPPTLIGYRALMVALSDLAAMAAVPRYCLVSLTLPADLFADSSARPLSGTEWVAQLAHGMGEAAESCQTAICGGNLSQGPLSITVSVHGVVDKSKWVGRSGACPGDVVYLSGPLGGAAACVRQQHFEVNPGQALDDVQEAYFHPKARFDWRERLIANASAAIDVSDGLLQDLGHVLDASRCGANLDVAQVPIARGASLHDALSGGDDYQILFTAGCDVPGAIPIGKIVAGSEMTLDGTPLHAYPGLEQYGYQHFKT